MEDQISYPLTVALLGVPGVRTVRSFSMFGFSTIYVIFNEDVEFYWSRTRLLEKLSSLPPNSVPAGVTPTLGPDAIALGQVFWYTLEGRDSQGNPAGGWDLDELRSIQDWYVRYALLSAEGVSEVASVGGFVKEYQVDVDPDAMRAHNVTLGQVFNAVKMSNLDVGARTIEVNNVEYVIRGIGFLESVADLESAVVAVRKNQPIRLKDLGTVRLGPALRRGALDKGGAEAVGGVAVVRYGSNPLAAIKNIKQKIAEITPGLPAKTLSDGTVSKVTIVPFYDRSGLIHETLGTLQTALSEEILVTIIVVVVALLHLRSSLLISSLLPMAVLMCFIAMKAYGVDANIVALSGIAIAIGTMVDMGIIICENILKHLEAAPTDANRRNVVFQATSEVGGAVLTAMSTTIVSFLPVFAMTGAEGKLFMPLAFTKTFALVASIIVALTIIPPFAHLLFTRTNTRSASISWFRRFWLPALLVVAGLFAAVNTTWWQGLILVYIGLRRGTAQYLGPRAARTLRVLDNAAVVLALLVILARHWLPLGPEQGELRNMLFVTSLILCVLALFQGFQRLYPRLLRLVLDFKGLFLLMPLLLMLFGAAIWLGFPTLTGWLPQWLRSSAPAVALGHALPGLGKEFMPRLDEGSFLFMPTTMPHAGFSEVQEILAIQDMALTALPEVESAVGKLGRAETPLDPAPISMIETVINYRPEYLTDKGGARLRFAFDPERVDYFRNEAGDPVPAPDGLPYLVQGKFLRDAEQQLIPDADQGQTFRLWRLALDTELNPEREAWPGIRTPDDIWDAIVHAAEVPGATSAPNLQPIAARIVMLQSGMRAPMGVKVKGPDLETIEQVGLELERLLKQVPTVQPHAVIADRIVGKPYLEIVIDREAISRHGIMISQVQEVIETALGGRTITTTVEGRERYPVRVRYLRELRDSIEGLETILVPGAEGEQIPLAQLALIRYVRGPQVIKSEDTFLTGYVLFDKKPGYAEVDVVEQAKAFLEQKRVAGELKLPPGVSYNFAGSYENQVRAQKKLAVILPLALFVIVIILYLEFKAMSTTLFVFSSIGVAWAGGFIMLWLYGQPWFLDFTLFGTNMRELFQVRPVNLSVAVWVGFLALFGIASDDGVLMATYLKDRFRTSRPQSVAEVRAAVIEGAQRRIRPALMTSATTILALMPVLTSRGCGSDIMVPMAIPSFGGMTVVLLSVFLVPVLYCWVQERRVRRS